MKRIWAKLTGVMLLPSVSMLIVSAIIVTGLFAVALGTINMPIMIAMTVLCLAGALIERAQQRKL